MMRILLIPLQFNFVRFGTKILLTFKQQRRVCLFLLKTATLILYQDAKRGEGEPVGNSLPTRLSQITQEQDVMCNKSNINKT